MYDRPFNSLSSVSVYFIHSRSRFEKYVQSVRFAFLQIDHPQFSFLSLTELNNYNKKESSEPSDRRRPATIYHRCLFPLETARERKRAGTEEAGRNLFRFRLER